MPEQLNLVSWIDSEHLKVISSAGLEKTVKIVKKPERIVVEGELPMPGDEYSHEFIDIEYNQIPMFNIEESKSTHYDSNRPSLDISDVEGRLIRKYQKYKTSYNLFLKQDASSMYQEMFSVDYGVENGQGTYCADHCFTFL